MRSFKIAGMLFVLALAASAVASASAFAAKPEYLGTLPATITGSGGENELKDLKKTGLVIKCSKAKVSGSTQTKISEVTVDLEGCKIGGLAAQSLGDKKGVILVPLAGLLCYVNASLRIAGSRFTLPSGGIHVEVPSLGELLLLKGTLVGVATPVNSSSSSGTMTFAGHQTCEGEEAEAGLALEKEHNGEPLAAEEVLTESLTFGSALTLDA